MKVYNKVVINIETGETLYEDSYEYDGPVALCGGGVGGSYGTSDQSQSSYGSGSSSSYSTSKTRGGSQSTASSFSRPDKALAFLSKQLYETAAPAVSELFNQFTEALTTGGVGAKIPLISRALEGTKMATSRALRETEEDLASRNLAGTPFGARTLADVRTSGALQEANVPMDIISQFVAQIPEAIGQITQTAIGGLTGARTEGSGSQATSYQASDSFSQSISNFLNQAFGSGSSQEYGADIGACCFIFIANMGYLHPVVRRYREDHMNLRNRRGYYWLADRLVPLMEKSRIIKKLVSIFMVNPMIAYGKYVYRFKPTGARYAPVASFWLFIFTLLGFRPPYRRRGTEEVV